MPSLAQKWLEQGIQQGIQKGIQQGIQKGMLHEAQEMVLEAIDAKFGACPEEIRKRIMAIEDRTKLKALLKEILLKSKLEDISLNCCVKI